MSVLIICGESSADFYGANLAQTLSSHTQTPIYSIGGQQLSRYTTQLMAIDTTNHSIGMNNSTYWVLNPLKKKLSIQLPL